VETLSNSNTKTIVLAAISVVFVGLAAYQLYTRIVDMPKDRQHGHDMALYDAINKNDDDALTTALANGGNVNADLEGYGFTPLIAASKLEGRSAIVKVLLDHGANVNAQDDTELSPLQYAAEINSVDVMTILLDHGAQIEEEAYERKWTPILTAVKAGSLDATKLLIGRGANVNAQETEYGETALSLASDAGKVELMTLLLDHGAQTETKDSKHQTAIFHAIKSGKTDAVKLLLDHKASPNGLSTDGDTPLIEAVESSDNALDLVKLLVTHGAHVNDANGSGYTAVELAAGFGKVDILNYLAQHAAK